MCAYSFTIIVNMSSSSLSIEQLYIDACFKGIRGSFMQKLDAFLKTDSNTADRILKYHRDLLLQLKCIPNKRRRALQTKNLEELCHYVELFFKQNNHTNNFFFIPIPVNNKYLQIATKIDRGF